MDPLLHRAYRPDQIGGWLLVLACSYFVLNTGAIAIAVALHEREPLAAVWRKHFSELWVSYAGGALGAALVVFALRAEGLVLPMLALPLLVALILHFAYKHATGRFADQLQHLAQVSRLQISTIESLAHAIDAKDCVTHAHIRRVQQDALRLAAAIGVRDDLQLKALERRGTMYDPLVIDAFLELVANDEEPMPAPPLSPVAASKQNAAQVRQDDRGERRTDHLSRAFTIGGKLARAQSLEQITDMLWQSFADAFDEHDCALLEAVGAGLSDRIETALSQVSVR
ncbi:MAG: hypothetical protein LC753_08290 [Acidobacteria bacterium]|nr:hypothetical protein [Acidobacteriota bacterium]MCA1650271.1 hypothetical protein [Acidobacteriota bacterium]